MNRIAAAIISSNGDWLITMRSRSVDLITINDGHIRDKVGQMYHQICRPGVHGVDMLSVIPRNKYLCMTIDIVATYQIIIANRCVYNSFDISI